MAEVQTNTQTGEMVQRFIEFVMMQAQNAALFLGQIPNPQTGEGEVNLGLAKMFIDQLSMIQEKTRGNLTNEEATVLRNTLSNLQMAFVEVSQGEAGGAPAAAPSASQSFASEAKEPPNAPAPRDEPTAASPQAPTAGPSPEGESRKKFTKSYGA